MNNVDSTCLDTFPRWLDQLSEDVLACATLATGSALPESARRELASGVNYLFRSLDLIPDGLEELGYLDDAMLLRACARRCSLAAGTVFDGLPPDAAGDGIVERAQQLAQDFSLIEDFLGEEDAGRLQRYSEVLGDQEVRGRTADKVLADTEVSEQWLDEVVTWKQAFKAPPFDADARFLIKLRAFLQAKLPG